MTVKGITKKMMKSAASLVAPFFRKRSSMTVDQAGSVLASVSEMPSGTCVGHNQLIKIDGNYEYDLQIVIPCYNVEPYIRHCLDSVISNMKNTAYKVIAVVVNDGSTDGTSEILNEYKEQFLDTPIMNRGGIYNRLNL